MTPGPVDRTGSRHGATWSPRGPQGLIHRSATRGMTLACGSVWIMLCRRLEVRSMARLRQCGQ
jgi:hypothetical protein